MRLRVLAGSFSFLAALLFGQPMWAHSISDGGFDAAAACTAVSCGVTETMSLATLPVAPLSGNITLDTVGLRLQFDVSVASMSLSMGGGEDNGVERILFSDTSYATIDPISLLPAPLAVFFSSGMYFVGPGQTVVVDGTHTQYDDTASVVGGGSFDADAARVTGSCTVDGDDNLVTCGLTFGSSGVVIPVGDPGGGHALDDRYFRATANVTLADEVPVPEPSSLALLVFGLGLAALAGGRDTS